MIDCRFSFLPQGRTLGIHKKVLKIQKKHMPGIRSMEQKDVKAVWKLLTDYLNKKDVHFIFNKEEVAHFFLPREKVMYAYVVENDEGEVTDFFSFYSLPSTVLQSSKNDIINAVFGYYNVAKNHTFTEIMEQAVIMAQAEGFDVYNCLDVLNNGETFEELKFGKGSGNLYYYIYNYQMNDVKANQVGIVLV
jgi:glycylpeptide N-tetradecanoyltransferase